MFLISQFYILRLIGTIERMAHVYGLHERADAAFPPAVSRLSGTHTHTHSPINSGTRSEMFENCTIFRVFTGSEVKAAQ